MKTYIKAGNFNEYTVKVFGVIGLGRRGHGLLSAVVRRNNIFVVAVLDIYKDRKVRSVKEVESVAVLTQDWVNNN